MKTTITKSAVDAVISEMKRRAALAPRAPGKDRSTAGRKAYQTLRANIARKIEAGELKP